MEIGNGAKRGRHQDGRPARKGPKKEVDGVWQEGPPVKRVRGRNPHQDVCEKDSHPSVPVCEET